LCFGVWIIIEKQFRNVDVFNNPKEVAAQSQLQPNRVSKIHPTLFQDFQAQQCKLQLGRLQAQWYFRRNLEQDF
jgi:hypothetical protein